jgi:hypothetical protein
LTSAWSAGALALAADGDRGRRRPDRWLVGLALVLFLAGVVVDRTRLDEGGVRDAVRRWRQRLSRTSVPS